MDVWVDRNIDELMGGWIDGWINRLMVWLRFCCSKDYVFKTLYVRIMRYNNANNSVGRITGMFYIEKRVTLMLNKCTLLWWAPYVAKIRYR